MRKVLLSGLLLTVILCAGYVAFATYAALFGFHTRLTGAAAGIVRHPEPSRLVGEALQSLPIVGAQQPLDLRGDDLRALDLRNKGQALLLAQFDSNTQWPSMLPDTYTPRAVLEMGKNPGLALRVLHRQGITGQGVSVAIVDQTLLVDHVEYGERLALYEEVHNFDDRAKAHGSMVASILAGKTTGVAPQAELYYIASSHWNLSVMGAKTEDYTWTAKAIDRLLEINQALPSQKKIRVISISTDWQEGVKGFDEVMAAAQRARAAGVMVVSVSIDKYYPYDYGGLGRHPLADPDAPQSYGAPLFITSNSLSGGNRLFVPIDSRTYASHTGPEVYTFERRGGYSQGAPYVAGLYALVCQVKPDIRPEQFWERAIQTADAVTIPVGDRQEQVLVVNPIALITGWQAEVDGTQPG